MPELSYSTPGLLFPAVSLLMLAYTNRFLSLAALIRQMVVAYQNSNDQLLIHQMKNLRVRIKLLRQVQALAVISLLFCTCCMIALFFDNQVLARLLFATALLSMSLSLALSLREISLSVKALNIELDRIQEDV